MKPNLILLLIMLLSVFMLGLYAQSGRMIADEKVTPDIVEEVIKAAKAGLAERLEIIPKGEELLWGFNNRAEFALATIGRPYQMYTLNQKFYSVSMLLEKENYITPNGIWRVPVVVDGEYRTFLSVSEDNGVWRASGIGGAELAREIAIFEKSSIVKEDTESGILLRVFKISSDFIVFSSNNGVLKAYPVTTALMSHNNPENIISYTLYQTLVSVKKDMRDK